MKNANGFKRLPPPQDGENIQPALVNSAIAGAFDKMPEGNHAEIIEATSQQAQAIVDEVGGFRTAHEARNWTQEYERRARVMPFVRFVPKGDPLPLEIGNVDKLEALDGSGTWYMFPNTENLHRSYGGLPEDPTQGQEAQGGPLHGDTGRGEKYAGGNVETDTVHEDLQDPQWRGKGSQTGGRGVQRAVTGDGSAMGAAVEDTDAGVAEDELEDEFDAELGDDAEVDTTAANDMAEGAKTSTDEAAEGAVTASNSASGIEQSSLTHTEGDDSGGTALAKQKSDEATPQSAPAIDGATSVTAPAPKTTKMHIGGKKKTKKAPAAK